MQRPGTVDFAHTIQVLVTIIIYIAVRGYQKVSDDQELVLSDPKSKLIPTISENWKYKSIDGMCGRLFWAATPHNDNISDVKSKKVSNDKELVQSEPKSNLIAKTIP